MPHDFAPRMGSPPELPSHAGISALGLRAGGIFFMKFARRTELYKRVQQISWRMMNAAQARGEIRGWQGPCVECGTNSAWSYRDDHRDYSEPLKIETVCASCNGRRGPALLMLFNVETAVWEQISPEKVTHA